MNNSSNIILYLCSTTTSDLFYFKKINQDYGMDK